MAFDPSKAREAVERSGRTRRWISDYMRIGIPSLNRILNGSAKPSKPIIRLLAMALECKELDFEDQQEVAS